MNTIKNRMLALLALIVLLWSAQADALSWRTVTRADWRSMDCLSRRLEALMLNLEAEDARNVKICLLHVGAMLVRHGGAFSEERAIDIGDPALVSDEEATLIMEQHGHAGAACNVNDLLDQLGDATIGRFKRWLIHAATASIPWALLTLVLWRRLRGVWRAYKAMDERAETLVEDRIKRREIFDDPDIKREHALIRSIQKKAEMKARANGATA